MPFRQIDLSQISTANSSNNQVIAVVANTIVWANVTASGGSANPLATSIVGLNTANVTESTSNLYFTNARVYSNIVSTLATYTGNIFAGNLTTTGATGGSITGANLLSTNNISSLNWIGLYTANVIETSGNLYFTDARVYSNIVSTLATYTGNINAGNIISGGALGGSLTGANLLSTNNISSLNWIGLYTANVIETSGNLYFTNARVYSNVISLLPTLAGDNITIAANGRISSTASGSGSVLATSIIGLNTANVSESVSNLYYTNARVYSNIVSTLATYTGNIFGGNLTTGGALGGSITGANLISANNFISTGGTITGANLISANNVTTTNITTTNLYTGSNGSGGSITGANLISANNVIATNFTTTNLYTGSNGSGGSITGANLISANNITVTNLTATNLNIIGGITDTTGVLSIATTGGTNANIELTANGTGRILLDGMAWPLTDGTSAQVLQTSGTGDLSWATVSAGGNPSAQNVIGLNTANVSESTSNLYFTNARVFSNVISLLPTYTGNINASNINITGRISANIWARIFTANVVETTGNLYFTNARVYSNVISLLPTYTGNLSVGNLSITGGMVDTSGILSISTRGANANIELTANGTGRIVLDGMAWPLADGTSAQVLQTTGTGNLYWATPSAGGGSGLFNSSITNSNNYLATSTLSNAIVFSVKSILHSVYITNIDTSGSANIGVTATILGGGTNAPMLFNMPLPYRSSFEALKKPKVVNAGDAIQIQGLESGVGINNDVHATIVYEEITSGTYTGINSNIATPYANVDIFTAASASIIESVMVSSTNNLGNIPITVTITNASNVIQGYMAYTLLVPVGATIELCEKPRRIASGHKIQAYTNAANAIAIFVAAKDV